MQGIVAEGQSQQPTTAQVFLWQPWQAEQVLPATDAATPQRWNELQLVNPDTSINKDLVLPVQHLNSDNTTWLSFLLLFVLLIFATVKAGWSKYIQNLFQSIVNYSTAERMFRERNYSFSHGAFRLDVVFYLVFSVFLFQLINFFRLDFTAGGYTLYIFCLAGTFVYFLGKKLLYKYMGFLFENTSETSEFLFNLNNTNRVAGMVLIPVVALLAFSPFSSLKIPVIIGILIVAAIYFLLVFRGVMILLRKQFSILYLFLYFCTLEFLPLVLVYKLLFDLVGKFN
ncbi:protein of unknown function [Tangfeifania diversioriginum]|uniref:DUF4271 domain-containing protein n=2 Tax=Tangfeifania diversioriginum TaxID=1168035 RepID=A0A1M6IEJ3_9BACT|nr:protein of unknown function [Tangfeifania diversioriginum]